MDSSTWQTKNRTPEDDVAENISAGSGKTEDHMGWGWSGAVEIATSCWLRCMGGTMSKSKCKMVSFFTWTHETLILMTVTLYACNIKKTLTKKSNIFAEPGVQCHEDQQLCYVTLQLETWECQPGMLQVNCRHFVHSGVDVSNRDTSATCWRLYVSDCGRPQWW